MTQKFFLLYDTEQKELLDKEVTPLFEGQSIELIGYKKEKVPNLPEGSAVITFLSDATLANFLPKCAKQKWVIGFLPHPEMKQTRQGMGIESRIPRAVEDILTCKKTQPIDILFCNDQPILNTVVIGNNFSIFSKASDVTMSWKEKIVHFFEKFRQLSNLHLQQFTLTTEKNKEITTAALSLVVFEHGRTNVLSRRLIEDSSVADGMLHTLLLAPRSLNELAGHYLSSFFPLRSFLNKLPPFVGHIKTRNLTISAKEKVQYTQDGILKEADHFSLRVEQKALEIFPGRLLQIEDGTTDSKESFKTQHLPAGESVRELVMYRLPLFNHSVTEEFKELFTTLRESAKTTSSYSTLMVLSTLLATLGLMANSSPVVIGAMILAPLIAPLTSLSMGALRQDERMILESLRTILIGTCLGLLFSTMASIFIPLKVINNEISSRMAPNLLDMGIAVISGIAGAYAHARAEVAKSLAGVAIAVALVPPLSVAGIGIGWLDFDIFYGSFLLFLTNLAGIVLAGTATFFVLGYSPFHLARKGILATFLVGLILCLPLAFSFKSMVAEKTIAISLNGFQTQGVTLKNVKAHHGDITRISATLVFSDQLDMSVIKQVKKDIEKELKQPIKLEASLALSEE